jgi:hypothetical protein
VLHFLLLLLIATVVVLGWLSGSVFIATFLTIADLLAAIVCVLFATSANHPPEAWQIGLPICVALFFVIWMPSGLRHR